MDVIEYENGLPKGYLERRKKANILYILSIYLYCLVGLLQKTGIFTFDNDTLYTILSSALIFLSCCFLYFYLKASRYFKGINMYNYDEFHALSKMEKLLYAAPIIIITIFIPLNMVIYFGIITPCYLAISSFFKPSSEKYE